MNPQSLGGRRRTRPDADTPRLCQALLGPDGPNCQDEQYHLFATAHGGVVGLCCLHRATALANSDTDLVPFDLPPGGGWGNDT